MSKKPVTTSMAGRVRAGSIQDLAALPGISTVLEQPVDGAPPSAGRGASLVDGRGTTIIDSGGTILHQYLAAGPIGVRRGESGEVGGWHATDDMAGEEGGLEVQQATRGTTGQLVFCLGGRTSRTPFPEALIDVAQLLSA